MRKIAVLFAVLLCSAFSVFAQTTIKGKVTDAKDGSPVQGATIRVRGEKTSVTSKPDGTFEIVSKSSTTLDVTEIGHITQSVKYSGSGTLEILLAQDTKALSEVVVTGVGTATSKKKLAISVESISADKLPAAPTASVDQALVGKIAGAQISSVNGNPGQPVNILLRGINSLQSGTTPMVLLDGLEVKVTNLGSLDLTAIERVEVIQGAAAATFYGAQGANGVIQLFSKKGRGGKINIDLSSGISYNSLINKGNVSKAKFHSLNTDAEGNVIGGSGNPLVFNEELGAYEENVVWNSLDPTNINNKPYNKNLLYYDHYKMFFQTAKTYNNSVSINGSKDKFDFNLAASDSRQESVFRGNGKYNRSNFVSNLGFELIKNLKLRSVTQMIYTKNTLMDETGRTIFYALNNSRPFTNYDFKDAQGNYGSYFGNAPGVNGFNPNYMFQYGHPNDNKVDVIQNFDLNYKFLKYFEADVKYGINYQNQEIKYTIDAQDDNVNADYEQYWLENYSPRYSANSPASNVNTGEINTQTYKTTFQNFLPSLTLKLDLENDFGIKIPIKSTTYGAFDYRKNVLNSFVAYGTDAPSYTPVVASSMTNYRIVTDTKTPFITYGYLFDQKFEYGDILGVAGGFRTDYSSAFGQGSKPFTFPHYNGYLRLSAFNFWQNAGVSNAITEVKFRAAYGKAGIQPGAFQRYVTLDPNIMGDNVAFSFKVSSPNPKLSVEVSQETEIGTDISFKGFKGNWFKNFNFSLTYWKRKTDNAIWQADAAPSTGVGTVTDNLFGIKSNGIQASLNMNVLSTKKLNWNFTTNFSKQSSEISFVKDKPVILISGAGSSGVILEAGKKIGQLFGYFMLHSVDERDPETGEPFIAKADQANFEVASNGWVVYADPAKPNYKQPYVTPSQHSFGDPNPKFNMAFINDVTFDGWLNLGVQIDWISGAHLYNQTKEWMYRDGIHSDYDKSITINGESGAWPAFYRGVYAQVSRNGTKNYFYENSSFARLRNLAVGVDFAKFFKVKGINKAQLVFTGRNIFTITNYTGMDPEISSGNSNSAWDRGVDHNSIPNIKSYQLTLNLGF